MKFTNPVLRYFIIALLLFAQKNTYAGGFPIKPGSFMLAPSVNYFFANKNWDTLRQKKPFSSNGRYNSVSIYLYTEYGISKNVAFVGQLPYTINSYKADNYSKNSAGLTDLETGIRYIFANIKNKYYFSLQGTLVTPLYSDPNLGYREEGGELKLAFAGSGKRYFFSVEDGVRQFFGSEGPIQNRYYGTFGVHLDKQYKNQLIVSLSGTYSSSNLNSAYNPTLASNNKNFAFNQATLSYGYAFSKKVTAYVAAATFISGRNTGVGSTLTTSLVLRPF